MKNDDPILWDFYHVDEPREWKAGWVKEYCDRNVPGLLELLRRCRMTGYYRNKYQKYPDRNKIMKHRPGGEDIRALCNAVEEMEKIIRWASGKMDDQAQNFCEGWMAALRAGLKS